MSVRRLDASAPPAATEPPRADATADPIRAASLEHDGRLFVLAEPLTVNVEYDSDGYCICKHDGLGVVSGGETRDAAFLDFCEDFADEWDCIACEADEALTADAREQKRRLVALVEKVVE
jgi:hypothetical protein